MKRPVELIGKCALLLVAALFIAAPIYSLLGKGPFNWHIEQPAAWQGGLEVLALMAVFFVALSLNSARLRIALGISAAWLFSRRHGVDFSILLVYLYAEGILALGSGLLRRIGMDSLPRPSTVLTAGLLGVVAWSLVIWITSAIGLGSLDALRLITIAVLGGAIVFNRGPRLAVLVTRPLRATGTLDRLAVALLAGFFFALFAKASVVIDYDSFWYGLQGEEVLVGEGSLYAAQGLASIAHYYPKLYEALQLPFAGLGSVSLIFGIGIFSWLMIVLTSSAILREFRVPRNVRLWTAALIGTLPAVANIAVSAKGDAFSAWLMLMAVLGLVRFRKGLGGVWFWVALSAIPLALMARLSNLPYAGILILVLFASLVPRWRRKVNVSVVSGSGFWIAAATALLGALVTARTILLAGVALIAPNALVRLQETIGFELKYPTGLLPEGQGLPEFPVLQGMWSFLFDPADLPHILITWPGNVWIFMMLAVVVLAHTRITRLAGTWPLLLVGLSFFVVLFGYKHPVAGGDGNYFIFPIICLTLWGSIRAAELTDSSRRFLGVLAMFFCLSGAAIAFVTGSWGPGSRALDLELNRTPFEYRQHASQAIAAAHLQGVERYFRGLPAGTRVVGLEPADLNSAFPSGWWLPVQYEPLQPYAWQQPELVSSSSSFEDYLRRAGIDYLLIPKQPVGGAVETVVLSALRSLQSSDSVTLAYQDAHYRLWKLKGADAAVTSLVGGGAARILYSSEEICAGSANVVGEVSWSSKVPAIAIEVKAAQSDTSSLWAEAGSEGQQSTGPWISRDAEFIFRSGRDGDVIGTIKVSPACSQ